VSQLPRQCVILNISQPYRTPRPALRIILLLTVNGSKKCYNTVSWCTSISYKCVRHTMGSPKVPRIVVLHCNNGRQQRLRNWLQSRTPAHEYTYSIEPAIVGITGERLLLESSIVWQQHLIWCPPWLGNVFPWGRAESHSERGPETSVVGWWQKLPHNKRCVVRCVIVMQKALSLPATCSAASSELHRATSEKLLRRNDHYTLSRRYELLGHQAVDEKQIPGTFWLPLVR
jgi:hypothetical protein